MLMQKMEYRPIEVKLVCAKDLKDVNVFSTMNVYVVGSVSGDPRSMQRTAVHKDGGTNPRWNHVMRFNVDESAARLNRLGLVFQIMSDRTLGDKEVGRVYVPLKELFDKAGFADENCVEVSKEEFKNVIYQVQTPTGRFKGHLEFSYKFGEKFTQSFDRKLDNPTIILPLNTETSNQNKFPDEPVMAYPVGPTPSPSPMSSPSPNPMSGPSPNPMPGPSTSCPPNTSIGQSVPYAYGGPPPGYPYQGYGHGYGYPPNPPPPPPNVHMGPGYGVGYPGPYGYPGQAHAGYMQQPAKKHGSKFGMGTAAGLGAGLLGGLLVGEMVEDVAEAAVIDDMYDL